VILFIAVTTGLLLYAVFKPFYDKRAEVRYSKIIKILVDEISYVQEMGLG
jgi:hypothetical protein